MQKKPQCNTNRNANKTATQQKLRRKENAAQTNTCHLVAVVSKHHTQTPFPPSANLKGSEIQKKLQCNKKQKRKTKLQNRNAMQKQLQCKNNCYFVAAVFSKYHTQAPPKPPKPPPANSKKLKPKLKRSEMQKKQNGKQMHRETKL